MQSVWRKKMSNKRCEYCEEGVCVYFKSLEEQYKDEEDGLPAEYCNGDEEQMRECFEDLGLLTETE